MFLSKRCRYAMINLSYLYNTDIQTILSSFSFPGTPYPRVPTQKALLTSFLQSYCFASINMIYGLAMFFCYNHRYYKAYNIYGYNTSLVFHLESSNENLKYVWSQVTQMRVIEMKNKCHKTLIVTVHQ